MKSKLVLRLKRKHNVFVHLCQFIVSFLEKPNLSVYLNNLGAQLFHLVICEIVVFNGN